jgi:hypothetical protein
MVIRRSVLVTALVSAALVAPAAAASQVRHSSSPVMSLDLPLVLSSASTTTSRPKNQTCQIQGSAKKGVADRPSLIGSRRGVTPVACEQPPRSQFTLPLTLPRSAANIIAIDG